MPKEKINLSDELKALTIKEAIIKLLEYPMDTVIYETSAVYMGDYYLEIEIEK